MEQYNGKQLIVRYDASICTHSGNCVRTLPAVFDVNRKPWVHVDGAAAATVMRVVGACPSGALSCEVVGEPQAN